MTARSQKKANQVTGVPQSLLSSSAVGLITILAAVAAIGLYMVQEPTSSSVTIKHRPMHESPTKYAAMATADQRRIREDEQSINEECAADKSSDSLDQLLHTLAGSPTFRKRIWEKQPVHIAGVRAAEALVALEEVAAAGLVIGNDNWFTEAGADDAVRIDRSLEDGTQIGVEVLLDNLEKHSTLSINGAGIPFDMIGSINTQFMGAFGLPVNTNMYITNAGAKIAIPPHNDLQDVFILQMQGSKHWKLFAPPEPLPTNSQVRGKNGDVVTPSELPEPYEVLLTPGSVLYVPRGYIHSTSTFEEGAEDGSEEDVSMHLTVGLATHTVHGTYQHGLQCAALFAAEKREGALVAIVSAGGALETMGSTNSSYRAALPLGFLLHGGRMDAPMDEFVLSEAKVMSNLMDAVTVNGVSIHEFLEINDSIFVEALNLMMRETFATMKGFMDLYTASEPELDPQGNVFTAMGLVDRQLNRHVRSVFGQCGPGMDVQTPESLAAAGMSEEEYMAS